MVGLFRRTRLLGCLLGVLGLAHCREPSELDRRVYLLMECEECVSGEEDSVVALGPQAVPVLADLLDNGPPAAAVTRYRDFLFERSRALSYGSSPPVDSSGYASRYLDLYRASYRIRSAGALARIGGPRSREALLRAIAANHEPALHAALQFALDSVWHQ